MKHINLFENFNPPYESSNSKFDLLKEVFENLDIEYDLNLKFQVQPISGGGENLGNLLFN